MPPAVAGSGCEGVLAAAAWLSDLQGEGGSGPQGSPAEQREADAPDDKCIEWQPLGQKVPEAFLACHACSLHTTEQSDCRCSCWTVAANVSDSLEAAEAAMNARLHCCNTPDTMLNINSEAI